MEKSLSPLRLTARRFFRNPWAVTGLVILLGMLLFCFVGGLLSPYSQQQVFYRQQLQPKEVASAQENTQPRFTAAPGRPVSPALQAQLSLAILMGEQTVTFDEITYEILPRSEAFYDILSQGAVIGFAATDIFTGEGDYFLRYEALLAHSQNLSSFTAQGVSYRLEGGQVILENRPVGYISRLVLRTELGDLFSAAAEQAIEEGKETFFYDNREFSLHFDGSFNLWSIRENLSTQVWDSYASPSKAHLLGTDKNGMDLLTRLMYGGRVSLLTGFAVVLLSGILGTILGLLAGYLGGWADEGIMRLVDVFYCIPTTPLLIILGALMDAMRLDVSYRLFYLILVLAILGWPQLARLVRGQVLSLREQEFMLAAEALGLRAGRRIFRHLLPNVFPQLIATCTMQLGSVILTEATLSFLGLGIKFPFASWGNIMNDVASVYVLTDYPFVWIPAGICLVLTVLGFHFVGDGLRSALNPKAES